MFFEEVQHLGVVDDFIKLKQSYVSKGSQDRPAVSKDKIRRVLRSIDRSNEAMIEAVFALLDEMPSQFTKAAQLGFKFRDGATTAHTGAHDNRWFDLQCIIKQLMDFCHQQKRVAKRTY